MFWTPIVRSIRKSLLLIGSYRENPEFGSLSTWQWQRSEIVSAITECRIWINWQNSSALSYIHNILWAGTPFLSFARMSFLWHLFIAFFIFFVELDSAQQGPTSWRSSPFSPSSFPLAVRNPYLNTWLAQGNNPEAINGVQSTVFWSNIVSISGYPCISEVLESSFLGSCWITVDPTSENVEQVFYFFFKKKKKTGC